MTNALAYHAVMKIIMTNALAYHDAMKITMINTLAYHLVMTITMTNALVYHDAMKITMTNALAYYAAMTITTVKSFIIVDQGSPSRFLPPLFFPSPRSPLVMHGATTLSTMTLSITTLGNSLR